MAISEKQTIFLIGALVVILIGRGYLIDQSGAVVKAERSKYYQKKISDIQEKLKTLKTEQELYLKIDSLENLINVYADSVALNNK